MKNILSWLVKNEKIFLHLSKMLSRKTIFNINTKNINRIYPFNFRSNFSHIVSHQKRLFSMLSPRNNRKDIIKHGNKIVTNSDLVNADHGLKSFLMKVYFHTFGGVLSSLSVGIASSYIIPHQPDIVLPLMGVGFVSAIGGIFIMPLGKCTTHEKVYKSDKYGDVITYYSTNSPIRTLGYYAIIGGMSLTICPAICIAENSGVLIPAMVCSTSIFTGAAYYAHTRKVGELSTWKTALHSGLYGLLGCSLFSLVSLVIYGPNQFSDISHLIDIYAGVPLFAGFIAYDTHKAIEMYSQKNPDHLGCSIHLYLDFMNILIRMIEILHKLKKDE